MIGDLIDRIQKTNLSEKDPDAEQMLQQGLGRTPDALYILAQTVLVQKYALDQAQTQLAAAKAQIEQLHQHPEPKHASSFLGNLLGLNQGPSQTPSPQGYAPPPPPPPYAPVGGGYSADPGGPSYGAPPRMGGAMGGGFLQNAMQTAAGVAAGALAFQGIESLMHGFGHAAGYGGAPGFGGMESGMGAQDRPVENITNNYYDENRDDRGEHGAHDVSAPEREIGNDPDLNQNTADQNTADQSDRDTLYGSNDDTSNDTANLDDSSFDDNSSSFDDDSSNSGDDTSF